MNFIIVDSLHGDSPLGCSCRSLPAAMCCRLQHCIISWKTFTRWLQHLSRSAPRGMDICLDFQEATTVVHLPRLIFPTPYRLLGCRMFHPPILNMGRFITTFGSILAFITMFFTIFSFITTVLNQLFIHRDLLVTISKISPRGR